MFILISFVVVGVDQNIQITLEMIRDEQLGIIQVLISNIQLTSFVCYSGEDL